MGRGMHMRECVGKGRKNSGRSGEGEEDARRQLAYVGIELLEMRAGV